MCNTHLFGAPHPTSTTSACPAAAFITILRPAYELIDLREAVVNAAERDRAESGANEKVMMVSGSISNNGVTVVNNNALILRLLPIKWFILVRRRV